MQSTNSDVHNAMHEGMHAVAEAAARARDAARARIDRVSAEIEKLKDQDGEERARRLDDLRVELEGIKASLDEPHGTVEGVQL